MDKIRELLQKTWVTAVLGFVLGLVIGLPVLGWGLFPVKWYDASPAQLRSDLKLDYARMVVESFTKSNDVTLAQSRMSELGSSAAQVLDQLAKEPSVNAQDLANFRSKVGIAAGTPLSTQPSGAKPTVIAPTQPAKTAAVAATPTKAAAKTPAISPLLILVLFVVLTILIGAAVAYVLFIRNRRDGGTTPPPAAPVQNPVKETIRQASRSERPERVERPVKVEPRATQSQQEPPVAQFMTTYTIGDDLYDDSFSIDSPSGEFLGECGVGISDTIGVGDPKKVTAFEVWLFDKNDIQTVTKVLMSDHAFNDNGIRQRLASKGEPILVEIGKSILLETATLQLEARVVDQKYGQGALPTDSFFDRMTLELAVWPKIK